MSKPELLELIAPLSPAQRCELRAILDEAPEPMTAEELENDPMMKVIRELEQLPPMDAPPDFSVNHDYYIRGGAKRES